VKVKCLLVTGAVAACLAGTAFADTYPLKYDPGMGWELKPDQVQRVQWAQGIVRRQLSDPDSAEFKNERVTADGSVCGWYNAKNRMGGYNGYQEYVVAEGDAYLEPVDPAPEYDREQQAWDDHCTDKPPLSDHDNAVIATGEARLIKALLNPAGVQWRNIEVHPVSGHDAVCGEFNAQDSTGVYAGYHRFIAVMGYSPGLVMDNMPGMQPIDFMTKYWVNYCEPSGQPSP